MPTLLINRSFYYYVTNYIELRQPVYGIYIFLMYNQTNLFMNASVKAETTVVCFTPTIPA